MGSLKYLLDSVILIEYVNGLEAARDFVEREFEFCAITPVTRAEVLTGIEASKRKPVQDWLDQLPSLGIDGQDADLAADLRRGQKWKLPDAFQAALSLRYQLKLATRSIKDFNPVKLDFVLKPY